LKNILKDRTKQFARNVIGLTEKLPGNYHSNHISRQLIRSATSVAANYRAACLVQTKPTFVTKLSIVIEEADESAFWLELIVKENLRNDEITKGLLQEAKELTSIFIASRITAQRNNTKAKAN